MQITGEIEVRIEKDDRVCPLPDGFYLTDNINVFQSDYPLERVSPGMRLGVAYIGPFLDHCNLCWEKFGKLKK